MRPVATIHALCTAYTTPFGPPAFGVIYGRIISGANNIFTNRKPTAHVSSQIAYAGFAIVRGNITYVSWIGRVTTGTHAYVNLQPIATIGSRTDAAGQVITGEANVLSG